MIGSLLGKHVYQVSRCQCHDVVLESSFSDVVARQTFLVLHPKAVFDEPGKEINLLWIILKKKNYSNLKFCNVWRMFKLFFAGKEENVYLSLYKSKVLRTGFRILFYQCIFNLWQILKFTVLFKNLCTTCRYIHESRFVNDEVEPVDQVSEVITAKPEVRVMTGASKGENRS
jgi:hypothetical protein